MRMTTEQKLKSDLSTQVTNERLTNLKHDEYYVLQDMVLVCFVNNYVDYDGMTNEKIGSREIL